MDEFDLEERELTGDDELARRVLSLAIEFMNAKAPIPSEAIYAQFYPGMSRDTAIKTFSRDRDRLAQCGIVLSKSGSDAHDNALWSADTSLSFVQGPTLSEDEALLVDLLCLPLANDPSFALRDELRLALAKLDASFSKPTAARVAPEASKRDRVLSVLRAGAVNQKAVKIEYEKIDGSRDERVIAPYGFFSLRGTTYCVAPRIDVDGAPVHTYNVSRVLRAAEQPRQGFTVPEDFDVRDWLKLPFQMGAPSFTACFRVPAERERELRKSVGAAGSFERGEDGTLLLTVDGAELEDAASWAVAEGVIPLAPPDLKEAWTKLLKEVAS